MKVVRTYLLSVASAMLCILSATCGLSACKTASTDPSWEISKGDVRTLIVYYDAKVGKSALLKAAGKYGSKVYYEYRNFNAVALSVPSGKNADEAVAYYNKVKGVVGVSRDGVLHLD